MAYSKNDVQIFRAGRERLDEIGPLWKALHTYHASVASQLGEMRPLDESWFRRRANYETWLNETGAFMLIAEKDNKPVGYAFIHLKEGSVTWQTADCVAELETLSVLPEFRNLGIGSALMKAIYSELRTEGARELSVSVVSTNVKAIHFYERQGLIPKLVSFLGRVPT